MQKEQKPIRCRRCYGYSPEISWRSSGDMVRGRGVYCVEEGKVKEGEKGVRPSW